MKKNKKNIGDWVLIVGLTFTFLVLAYFVIEFCVCSGGSLIFTGTCKQKDNIYLPYNNCICDGCIRINLANYQGNQIFSDGIPMGIITDKDIAIPLGSEIQVCMRRNEISGDCENELFKFKISGKC